MFGTTLVTWLVAEQAEGSPPAAEDGSMVRVSGVHSPVDKLGTLLS
jgi:hypothetical protein